MDKAKGTAPNVAGDLKDAARDATDNDQERNLLDFKEPPSGRPFATDEATPESCRTEANAALSVISFPAQQGLISMVR